VNYPPIKSVQIINDEIVLILDKLKIVEAILFLKKHFDERYEILTFIFEADYTWAINRFEISYELLSILYNTRLRLKICTS
jgi:NADH:ubiquinone oxidoreductase subunit C